MAATAVISRTERSHPVLWVTRSRIRVNRTATAWLVRRFIDPEAAFCFVELGDVARVQRDRGAIGFDAPGARYPHQDRYGRCSFEALADEYRPGDVALGKLALIVHAADLPDVPRQKPQESASTFATISLTRHRGSPSPAHTLGVEEAAGLRAISQGFPLVAHSDHDTLERSGFLYDALYASLRGKAQ
jgi:hypothetical protein